MKNNNKKKRGLVVSGGGAKGAFAGGIVEQLTEKGIKHDLYIGSSTGTLINLFTSTDNVDKLKEGYTNVTNNDIWSINPFKVKENKNGRIKIGINWFNILRNICPKLKFIKKNKFPYFTIKIERGSLAFGSTKKLGNLIRHFLNKNEYLKFKEIDEKEMLVCVVNATLKQIEYKSTKNWGYDDFCDWVHASCSAYPFMEPIIMNNMQYIDGGTLESIPIQEAINRGATEIDVIILKEENPDFEAEYIRNPFQGIINTIDMMHTELNKDDVTIGKLRALSSDEDIILNFYHTPRKLTNNSLVFNKELMNKWWDEGYEYAKNGCQKKYKLSKGIKAKLLKD